MMPIRIIGILLLFFLAVLSCQKESSCEGCDNESPIARAGPDQFITLPTDSLLLDGSSSSDPDGRIVSYQWEKFSGPASFSLANASADITTVRNLERGVYELVLTVKDNYGLSSRDTMSITVVLIAPPGFTNQPPIANAGNDLAAFLPADSVLLNGSGTDPDGSIVGYRWSKVSGPSSFTIVNPNSPAAMVRGLTEGTYTFELEVTDNDGASARDTTAVTVQGVVARPAVNLQLISVGKLSEKRYGVAVATLGTKIFFAGGHTGEQDPLTLFTRVDIYDISSGDWSSAELSEARTGIGAVGAGNKVFFAGGAKNFNNNVGWYNSSTRVDIYDVVSNTWAKIELPIPQHFFYCQTAAFVSKKLFFAGRQDASPTNRVYMYDVSANDWSSVPLTIPRVGHAIALVRNKVFIAGGRGAGGNTTRVDVFNASINSWTQEALSEGRSLLKAAVLNNKVYFAGGSQPFSSKVDIYDGISQTWTGASLSRATVLAGAAGAGEKVLFFGGSLVDVYDVVSDTWRIANISQTFSEYSAFIGAGEYVYATAGDQVWRIQF
jgi:hypothetical protein